MQYEAALRLWGAQRLQADMGPNTKDREINLDTVKVDMVFSEGYACCGGSDPDCYCSFAESPSADVVITGVTKGGRPRTTSISNYGFDFVTILGEIVNAADGKITG